MKVIALNSGGFDSVVMINELLDIGEEVISLFFNWGQPNYEQEKLCAEKIGARCSEHLEVKIDMPWVNTDMTDKMYIPMRNLVFSSYAVSLAEQQGIEEIYMAIIYNGHDIPYFDCDPSFYKNLNTLIEGKDIQIVTPYINFSKYELVSKYARYGMSSHDYFSCNTPKDCKPCGECGDCQVLKEVTDLNIYRRRDFGTEEFKKAYYDTYVNEVRLLINNECQFTCKHCFYGCGEEKMPRLTTEEFKDVIKKSYEELGVENIHFSGKEPLIDGSIFYLTEYIDNNYPTKTYDIVTNGATISTYINDLSNCKNLGKLFLSVDTLTGDTTLRNTNKHLIDNINLLKAFNIPIQITIDITKDNAPFIEETIQHLVELGIKDIYIRSIKPNGDAKDIQDAILNAQEYGEVLYTIYTLDLPSEVIIEALINKDHVEESIGTSLEIYQIIGNSFDPRVTKNFNIVTENYCYRYLNNVTITPDGYMLGCAMDVSVPYYDELSGGNVRDKDIVQCLFDGRANHLDKFVKQSCKKGCTFCK